MKKFIQLIKATGCRSNLLSIFSKGKKLIDIRLNKVAYFFDIECCIMFGFIDYSNISFRPLNCSVHLRQAMSYRQKSIFKYFMCRCQRSEEHTSELQSRPHLVCRL